MYSCVKTMMLIIFSLVVVVACGEEKMAPAKNTAARSTTSVSDESWQKLAQKRIYFGHQSVGYNILDGIRDVMKEDQRIKLNIVEINNPSEITGPILAHSKVGKNTDPKSKSDAFMTLIAGTSPNNPDIAFLKYCYVDVDARSDVNRIFADYKKTIDQLRKDYPRMAIVHFTIPLATSPTTIKTKIKTLVGKKDIWEYNDNIKRNEFNEKLRKEYGGKEPLFDLADIESTYPDGSKSTFRVAGKTYYSMVPGYTTDGGHLNETGRKVVARELLSMLSELRGN